MKKVFSVVKELSEFPAPSGYERFLSEKIKTRISKYVDRVKIDEAGGLIAVKKGKGRKKLLLTAHIDEIYMYVKKISSGFAIIETHGIDKKLLQGQEVYVVRENGEKIEGIIGMIPPHLKGEAKESDIYVDLGEDAEKLNVEKGNIITFKGKFSILNETRCSSKSLDNRAGASVLLLLIEKLSKTPYYKDLIFFFNAQEETGGTGVVGKAFEIYPDESIIVDATFAKSFYTKEEISDIELGKGPAIGVGPFIDRKIKDRLLRVCKKHKIPYQIEVLSSGTGTDLDKITLLREGIPCGLISIPLRYMHTPCEVVDIRDIEWSVQILKKYIEEAK
jgi:endoglucanase